MVRPTLATTIPPNPNLTSVQPPALKPAEHIVPREDASPEVPGPIMDAQIPHP
jgi:hypothetical protein